jgi:outer membrane protein assembly factor BamB
MGHAGAHDAARAPLPAGARPGYLIIVPEALADLDRLIEFVAFKRGLGFNVFLTSQEEIRATPPRTDFAEQIREYLKRVYRHNTTGPSHVRYVLLVGDGDLAPLRRIYPKWDPALPLDEQSQTRSDWYYADLTGNWDSNGDGFFGQGAQFAQPTDAVDLHYDVAVGRLPFSAEATVEFALETIMTFEIDGGAWKGRALQLAAFMEFDGRAWKPAHDLGGEYHEHGTNIGSDTDTAVVMERIWNDVLLPAGVTRTRLYETSLNPLGLPHSSYAADDMLDEDRVIAAWNEETRGLVLAAGHGSAGAVYRLWWEWDRNENERLEHPTEPIDGPDGVQSYGELDISSYLRTGRLGDLAAPGSRAPLTAVSGCGTAGFEDFDDLDASTSLGASFVALGRASAYIGALGTTGYQRAWRGPSGGEGHMQDLLLRFTKHLFTDTPRVGDAIWTTQTEIGDEAVADVGVRGKSMIKHVLYGDPAMSYFGNGAAFEGPWPMFRHDLANRGLTAFSGPEVPQVRWTFPLAPVAFGRAVPSPIVAAGGTIYVGSEDGLLYAVNPDGTEKWRFASGGSIGCAPIMTVDGTLYFRAEDGFLYALHDAGNHAQQRWRRPVEHEPGTAGPTAGSVSPAFSNSPRVSTDGTVYALAVHPGGGATRTVFNAYRPFGAIFVTSEIANSGAAGTPALSPGGILYVVSWDGVLRSYAGDLTETGSFFLGATAWGSPAVDGRGRIYAGTIGGRLYALEDNLSERWHFDLPQGENAINSTPAVGDDGSVYFGSWNNRVYCLEADGSQRWEFDTRGPVDSSPALDANSVYVVGGPQGEARLFCLERATGMLRWSVLIRGNALWGSSPAIGYDGVVYVVSSAGQLFAIGPKGTTAAPSDASAEATSSSEVKIRWRDNSPNEKGFRIERREGWRGAFALAATVEPNVTEYVDRGLVPAATYFYRVQSLGSAPSGYSNEARVRVPRPVPARPSGLKAQAESAWAIRLTWATPDRHTVGVNVYRSTTTAGPFQRIGQAIAGKNTFVDRHSELRREEPGNSGDPHSARSYFYRICAFNGTGESLPSLPVPGSTRGLHLTPPGPVTIRLVSPRQIRVEWKHRETAGTGYVVERTSDELAGFETVAKLPRGASFHVDSPPEPGFYTYRVKAVGTANESPYAVSAELELPRFP